VESRREKIGKNLETFQITYTSSYGMDTGRLSSWRYGSRCIATISGQMCCRRLGITEERIAPLKSAFMIVRPFDSYPFSFITNDITHEIQLRHLIRTLGSVWLRRC
jgi:hypothetical protein